MTATINTYSSMTTCLYLHNGIYIHMNQTHVHHVLGVAQEFFTIMTQELTEMWPLISRMRQQTYSDCHKLLQQFLQMAQRLMI